MATMLQWLRTCRDGVRGFFAYHKPLVIPSLILSVAGIALSSACLALDPEGGTKDCNIIDGWDREAAIACYALVSPLVVS